MPLRGTSGGYLPLAIESLMDRIAVKLDIDPVELRRRNALDVGSRTHLGQIMTDSVGIRAELDALRAPYRDCLSRPRGATDDTPWRRGVGVGCGWRSITYVNMPDVSAAVELMPDGRVGMLAGSVEQGQGAMTELAQIASEALDLPMDAIEVTIGDTYLAPYPVPTFSSITTLVTGKAVENAANGLKEALCRVAAELLDTTHEDVRIGDGFAFADSTPGRLIPFSQLCDEIDRRGLPRRHEGVFVWEGRATDSNSTTNEGEAPDVVYGFNACVADVEVNVENGRVRLNRLINAADPGTIIHPQALQGQIDGGLAFGIGIALSEAFHPERPPTLTHYGLPTTRDVAEEVTSHLRRRAVPARAVRGEERGGDVGDRAGAGHHQRHRGRDRGSAQGDPRDARQGPVGPEGRGAREPACGHRDARRRLTAGHGAAETEDGRWTRRFR